MDEPVVIRHEEELLVEPAREVTGAVRAHKRVETNRVERDVPRGIEQWDVERVPPEPEDSGQVESLPDGSISVPLFAEEIVVEKRRVVRERVIVPPRGRYVAPGEG